MSRSFVRFEVITTMIIRGGYAVVYFRDDCEESPYLKTDVPEIFKDNVARQGLIPSLLPSSVRDLRMCVFFFRVYLAKMAWLL